MVTDPPEQATVEGGRKTVEEECPLSIAWSPRATKVESEAAPIDDDSNLPKVA